MRTHAGAGVAWLLIAGLLISEHVMTASEAKAVQTVRSVDLDRYVGDWFEIARFPNRFQQKCVGDVKARYAKRADGKIDVANTCRTTDGTSEAAGVARVVDTSSFARLQVRFAPAALSFLPFVWGDYWILGLGPDYSWAVVGTPDRKYLWILSRTARLDHGSYAAALDVARLNGFDVDRLVPTSQSSDVSSADR
jgi:apolipoprotein D and lipocalin family protein